MSSDTPNTSHAGLGDPLAAATQFSIVRAGLEGCPSARDRLDANLVRPAFATGRIGTTIDALATVEWVARVKAMPPGRATTHEEMRPRFDE